MIIVDVDEAKKRLFELVEEVAQGERMVITMAGQPVADLAPHQRTPSHPRWSKGSVRL
jgi:prevent-host-death family protein